MSRTLQLRRARGAAFLAAALGLGAAPGRCADPAPGLWRSERGDAAGTGAMVWRGEGELNEWHYTTSPRHRYRPGLAVWASAALAEIDGRPTAFLGGFDQTLHALDLLDKRTRWTKVTNAEIGCAPAVGNLAGQPVVFLGSNDRTVYALAGRTGTTLWTRELIAPTPTLGDTALAGLLLLDDALYVTVFAYDRAVTRNDQRGWLFCLAPADGAVRWKLEISQGFVSAPAGFTAADGRRLVLVAARKGLLQAVDVSGAEPVRAWQYQMPHEVLGMPVVDADRPDPIAFLGSKYGNLIALDALTGRERWKRMAGNWIDNAASVGRLNGTNVVFVGSYDYCVHAFRSDDGRPLWRTPLGGEVHAAPAFFELDGTPALVVASLDNHVYLLDAVSGRVETSFYTGRPLWDKISKGETVWGSPVVVQAGQETAAFYGAFNETAYVLPLVKPCSLQARARSVRGLWVSLGVVAVVFLGLVLPVVLLAPDRRD